MITRWMISGAFAFSSYMCGAYLAAALFSASIPFAFTHLLKSKK